MQRYACTVPDAGQQDVVDPTQLHVDLEAEVGQRLRRRLVHVLGLDALRREPEHDVSDALHLSCNTQRTALYQACSVGLHGPRCGELRSCAKLKHPSQCVRTRMIHRCLSRQRNRCEFPLACPEKYCPTHTHRCLVRKLDRAHRRRASCPAARRR